MVVVNGISHTNRLSQLCLALNLSITTFAAALEEPLPRIERAFSSGKKPTLRLQARVLSHWPQVNPTWLLLGVGEMFRPSPGGLHNQGNNVLANYGQNIQIVTNPGNCNCTIHLLQEHLREKERVIQLLSRNCPSLPK